MKFIFPKNYDFSSKLFGLLDYKTAIFNIIWFCIIFFITKLLKLNFLTQVIILIIICLPVFLLSIFSFNNENIFYFFKYLFKYLKNKKIYLYKK